MPPEDEPDTLFSENWTDEQLAEFRENGLSIIQKWDSNQFTCDTCELKRNCQLVFDAYNTDGDCLAMK